jgi:tight adherence protein B
VVAMHAQTARGRFATFTDPVQSEKTTALRSLARLFGFDPERTALYPIKWWIILTVTAVIAWFSRNLIDGLLEGTSYLAVPVIWVMMSRSYFGWIENKRRTALLEQFPDALSLIVRAIRVGIPVMEGVRIVSREVGSPTAGEFVRLTEQVAIGSTLEDAVADMARRSGLPEYRFFATALSLQNQTGGTLSETLENLADVIRKRAALKSRGKALTSEARSSAVILACLPFVTGGMLYVINPPYIMTLFVHPTGRSMLGGAVLSLSAGLFIIRMIIKKSLPR